MARARAGDATAVHPARSEAHTAAEPVLLEHRNALEGMDGFGLWLPAMPFPGSGGFVNDFTLRWEPEYPDEPIGMMLDHHSSADHAAAQVTQRAADCARRCGHLG